ncbi:MAG TPA: hypothetical protein VK427_14255 [Kofleriaceae bacterium]|nr:hypothetical protein [Kofleriaceae bacterium]
MKPIFSREAVVDRRQPYIRWSAVLAGAALTLGLWNLLNLLFIGGALTAVDPDELDHAGAMGIGTGIGSVLAPLIAMFVGGLVAGRLASHYDRRVSATHGALNWAISSVLGLAVMALIMSNLVDKRMATAHGDLSAPPQGAAAYVDDQLRVVNQHLKSQSAPEIAETDFLEAARHAAGDGRNVNKDAFVSRLDTNTKLSRPEAEAALDRLGEDAPNVLLAAQQLAVHRQHAMEAAEDTGNGMLAAGAGLFLCLAASVVGALVGARLLGKRGTPDARGVDAQTHPHHTTAPYPVTPAPGGGEPTHTYDPNVRRDPRE